MRAMREQLGTHRREFYAAVSGIGRALGAAETHAREVAALRLYEEADVYQARSQVPSDRHAARARYLRYWGDRTLLGLELDVTRLGGSGGRGVR